MAQLNTTFDIELLVASDGAGKEGYEQVKKLTMQRARGYLACLTCKRVRQADLYPPTIGTDAFD